MSTVHSMCRCIRHLAGYQMLVHHKCCFHAICCQAPHRQPDVLVTRTCLVHFDSL